jgi:hypothetical protein
MLQKKMTRKELQGQMVADSVANVGQPGDDLPALTALYEDAYGRMGDGELVREHRYVTGARVTLY